MLVLATGFRVDSFVRPMDIVGRDGVGLDGVWRDGPFAYLAIGVPGFPNLFMLNGPNGPVGNFSLIEVAELQETVRELDPNAFFIVQEGVRIGGNFTRKIS